MTSQPAKTTEKPKEKEETEPKTVKKAEIILTDEDYVRIGMKINVKNIVKGVETTQNRFISRAIRTSIGLRHRLNAKRLLPYIFKSIPDLSPLKQLLVNNLLEIAQKDNSNPDVNQTVTSAHDFRDYPEVIYYFCNLVLGMQLKYQLYTQAISFSQMIIENAQNYNRHSLDLILGRVYYFYVQANVRCQKYNEIRSRLLSFHRTACLHKYEYCQAVLLNSLLHNDILHKDYDSAYNIITKTNYPVSISNNQYVRYLYYSSFVNAIQLSYSEAANQLNHSLRKAPDNIGKGFIRKVTKLLVIITMLMGETPDIKLFSNPLVVSVIKPYLSICHAVQIGDLLSYQETYEKYLPLFKQDRLDSFIERLRHNVIKIGLHKITLSYDRISLKDITKKLHFDSIEDAEYICSKTIHDGVIDAEIDHENQLLIAKERVNEYASLAPIEAFQKRTDFCNDVYCEAMKSMRYSLTAYKELDNEEEQEDTDNVDDGIYDDFDDVL